MFGPKALPLYRVACTLVPVLLPLASSAADSVPDVPIVAYVWHVLCHVRYGMRFDMSFRWGNHLETRRNIGGGIGGLIING